MITKELRQSLRRGVFIYPFMAIQACAVLAVAVEFQTGDVIGNSEANGLLNIGLLVMAGPFWWVASGVCLALMPMTGLLLMGQELDEGNHELLLLTKLNRWTVVIGKFAALWGLCVLTFISLLPYLVVRYMVGGVEWAHELACAGTVVGGSAILCAGAIGASAFRRTAARMSVFILFIGSMLAGCGAPLLAIAMASGGCGVFYHVTALVAIFAYSLTGLALARSRLRLSLLAYEVSPSGGIIGLLVFAPFVIGLLSAMSFGWGGILPLLGVAAVAWRLDRTHRAPSWASVSAPNLPPPLPPAA